MLYIMLVDDSLTMRRLLKSTIDPLGNFEFIECQNGQEALDYILSDQQIDCIFLDINMPVMGGLELIDILKSKGLFDSLNIILASTEIYNLSKKYLEDLNILGVIPKPFKKSEITASLIPLLDLAANKTAVQQQHFEKPILIIDDSISMRKIIKKQLSSIGCSTFYEASNGKEGLNFIADHSEELSLIILDLHMPQMDGTDLLEQLKKSKMIDNFHIILISTDLSSLSSIGSKYPLVEIMAKPFKQKDINTIVIPILKDINPQNYNEDDTDEEIFNEKKLTSRVTIQDCLSNYFFEIEELIEKNIFLLENKKGFDYFKFKNFLQLSIENLTKIDAQFIDSDLKDELNQMNEFEKIYKGLGIITGTQKRELFQNAFLNHQKPYNKLLQRTQTYYENIKKGTIKHEKAINMLQFHEGDDQRRKTLESYKLDIEEKLVKLQKAYEHNLQVIDEFERENYGDFEVEYNLMRKEIKDAITSILNTKYYRVDKMIWKRANVLGSVQTFCHKNKINTPLDAREFLKYFLKTTKIAHENSFYKEMLQILQIFQKQKRDVVAIVYENIAQLETMKNILQQYNKQLVVLGFTTYTQLLQEKKLDLDLIILDYQMKNLHQYIESIKQRYSDSNFLLLFQNKSTQDIFDAISSGLFHPSIKNYLNYPKYLDINTLTDKVSRLL